jgi:hypothetical protein
MKTSKAAFNPEEQAATLEKAVVIYADGTCDSSPGLTG